MNRSKIIKRNLEDMQFQEAKRQLFEIAFNAYIEGKEYSKKYYRDRRAARKMVTILEIQKVMHFKILKLIKLLII